MPKPYETPIGSWVRTTTFFWAAIGATFGLANVWQFPYLASQHGGGLFVLFYVGCLVLVTLPLMVTETTMGRFSRHGLVLAMDGFVRGASASRGWVWLGRLAILAAFLVLSFTTVFGAVALAYVFQGAMGRFIGADEAIAADLLARLMTEPAQAQGLMAWHAFFLLLVGWVSLQGVVKGLERTLRSVVPILIILVLVFLALALIFGETRQAASVMLATDVDDFGWAGVRAALFHAFFTLGLGMGVWTLFGAYTPPRTRIKRSILAVVLVDTLLAISVGLAIYSVLPSGSVVEGNRGFSLLFVSLPVSLAETPGNQVIITAIYLMMVMMVWTSSLALLEPIIGWFREWTGAPRRVSVLIVGAGVWLAGLASLLSFNAWADLTLYGGTIFRWIEMLSGGLLIPAVAILMAVFSGWVLTRPMAFKILGNSPSSFQKIWLWVMRLILPVVVTFIAVAYSGSSLSRLCDNQPDLFWCEAGTALQDLSPLESANSEERVDEFELDEGTLQPESPESEENQDEPDPESSQPTPDEGNSAEEADIRYHSA